VLRELEEKSLEWFGHIKGMYRTRILGRELDYTKKEDNWIF
jgi:hypothetical protein